MRISCTVAATPCGATTTSASRKTSTDAGRELREAVAGPRLAEPALGQRRPAAVDHLHARVAAGGTAYDVGGAVGRAVVEHDDLEVAQTLGRQHRSHARLDARRLVTRRDEDADALHDRGRVRRRRTKEAKVVRRVRGREAGTGSADGDQRLGAAGQSRPVHSW